MSIGSHRGPLPLLNVSEEEAWQWRQHRLATSQAYEALLGYPVPFEDLASTDDAFEGWRGVRGSRCGPPKFCGRCPQVTPGANPAGGLRSLPLGRPTGRDCCTS